LITFQGSMINIISCTGEYSSCYFRTCSGFSRRVKNGSFFAIFYLFSVT
jgi:hypothetical protein